MVFFAEVQKAFQSEEEIKEFECVATYHGAPCKIRLTDGQKVKLLGLLQKNKHSLTLDELRTIIYELLCEYHQTKRCYYEDQVEKVWQEEFRHLDFSFYRSPARTSGLSRSPTPNEQKLCSDSTPSSSQIQPPLTNMASEPTSSSPTLSHAANKNQHNIKIEPQSSLQGVSGESSSVAPGLDGAVESIEDHPPSRGRSRDQPSQASRQKILAEDEPDRPRSQRVSEHEAVAEEQDKGDSQRTSPELHSEEKSLIETDAFRFGSTNHDRTEFNFEWCGMKQLGSSGNRPNDKVEDVGIDISHDRLLKIFHDPNGVVFKKVQAQTEVFQAAENGATAVSVRPGTPGKQVNKAPRDPVTPTSDKEHRSSLTPASGRRRSSYEKSPSRSRSPSTPPLTERGKLAFATMMGDASYDRHVRVNERNVVRILQKPVAYTDKYTHGKAGWVYAIRDPELDLIKIGFTTAERPETRLKRLRSSCKLPVAAKIVEDPDRVAVLAFKRLEELVHADLAPHRWYFDCECGLQRGKCLYPTEHHEWYELSDDVALQTVRLWRDFIAQDPYGSLELNRESQLQAIWAKRIEGRNGVSEEETHADHGTRLTRWKTMFQNPSEVVPYPTAASSSTQLSVVEGARKSEEVEIKDEEDATTPLESIPPFDEHASALEDPLPPSVNPDLQLDGEHLSAPSTPPLISQEGPVDEQIEVADFGMNAISNQEQSFLTPINQSLREVQVPPEDGSSSGEEGRVVNPENCRLVNDDFVLAQILSSMELWFCREREGLSKRSIYGDLRRFRWPLTSAVMFALYAPYGPPILSMMTWSILLPWFVAEMREWW